MSFLAVYKVLMLSLIGATYVTAECDSPPIIENARNNLTGIPPFPPNTTVRYDCELGYNPAGTSRFYSCTGTTWTNGNFWCEQIYCSFIETPENGRITNSPQYKVGTTIQFSCIEGFTMFGQSKMLCRINGEWSPSIPPTCTAKDCGEFGSIQHAELFQDSSLTERNHYGSIVEVSCLDDRTLTGPSQVRCQADGTWGLRPTCEYVQCPPFPNLNSPCISSVDYLGSFLFISCNETISTHFGPAYADCRSGKWTTTEMGCLCDCILPLYNSSILTLKGTNSLGNLPHATMLDWTCHGDRVKSALVFVMCLDGKLNTQDGQGVVGIYSDLLDFTSVVISQLCVLPTYASSSLSESTSSSFSLIQPENISQKSTLLTIFPITVVTPEQSTFSQSITRQSTTVTKSVSILPQSKTTTHFMPIPLETHSQSITPSSTITTSLSLSSQSIFQFISMTTSFTVSTQSITTTSTMSTQVTSSSQSITRTSTISTPITVSSKSITPSSTNTTSLTWSSQSILPFTSMKNSFTVSSQSISTSSTMSTQLKTSSQSITTTTTMSTPVTISAQSITPSSTVSKSVTTSSQSISTTSSMSTPLTLSLQSITPSFFMSTPVTTSSQSITTTSTMSTPITVSTQSITPSSTMSTPVTKSTTSTLMSTSVASSSQSITSTSTMSTPVTKSSQSITTSTLMSTSVASSSQSITTTSSILSPVTVSSQLTSFFTTTSLPYAKLSETVAASSSVSSINAVLSSKPSFTMSHQVTISSNSVATASKNKPSVYVASQEITLSTTVSPADKTPSKVTEASSLSFLSTMKFTSTVVDPESSTQSTFLTYTSAKSTWGSHGIQNWSLTSTFNIAKVTNTPSSSRVNIPDSINNDDYRNGTSSGSSARFYHVPILRICFCLQILKIIW